MMRCRLWIICLGALFGFVSACSEDASKTAAPDTSPDTLYDAIIVGAGIAGLSAALELGRGGAEVLVIDMNSVVGGHAVMAGGFAFVDTPLQRKQGIQDSPEQAYQDWMAYGETNDPAWTRRYAENATPMVHDWLTDLGVVFRVLLPSPENAVRRFHFTRGKAVHAVLPLYREALRYDNVTFQLHTEVTSLLTEEGRITGVTWRNNRFLEDGTAQAKHIILATGGFQGDLDRVREHWTRTKNFPERYLVGAGHFARGQGHDLAADVNASFDGMDRQVTFLGGLPSPRDPARALNVTNPNSLWVNAQGQRFVNEQSADKDKLPRVLTQSPASYWMVFDVEGRTTIRIRDALWLNRATIDAEIFGSASVVKQAATWDELAADMGVDAATLNATVARYNRFIANGVDEDFARFTQDTPRKPNALLTPPFYAMQLFPVSRKNTGGVAINAQTQVIDQAGRVIPGLYAVGEVTGVAGINGREGMSGTFLGPSIMMGRLAAQSILDTLSVPSPPPPQTIAAIDDDQHPRFTPDDLTWLLEQKRPGYWHFEQAHQMVQERRFACAQCHTAQNPMTEPFRRAHLVARSETCLTCH